MSREPRVIAADIITILNREGYFEPGSGRESLPIESLAESAATSAKRLRKLLHGEWETIDLSLADRLCVALGAHISECRLDPPDS